MKIEIKPKKTLEMVSGKCDFCQQEKEGWGGEIEFNHDYPEYTGSYKLIDSGNTKWENVVNKWRFGGFWGGKIIVDSMELKLVVNDNVQFEPVYKASKTTSTVYPLICSDCIQQMAKQLK